MTGLLPLTTMIEWLFNITLDKNAPIKELTKKEEKDKLKPCVTKGIKKSVRDKICK